MFFDSIQWSAPSCTIIAGPSNSGKTSLLTKILIHKNNLFTTQNLKTILFFNQEQEIYKNWSDSGFINHSQKGIPSISDFQDITNFILRGMVLL
jgi:ABC-type lipoprotein export system ATPase subunit